MTAKDRYIDWVVRDERDQIIFLTYMVFFINFFENNLFIYFSIKITPIYFIYLHHVLKKRVYFCKNKKRKLFLSKLYQKLIRG